MAELPTVLVVLSSPAKTPDAPGADPRGNPESSKCPRGGGAASAALSARAAQRGSTTFVFASLHRALTLGASSGEGRGRDNNTPPPPRPPRRRRPVVAATHGGLLGSGPGLTTTPGPAPRALCGPRDGRRGGAGRDGGDRAAAHGWGKRVCGAGRGTVSGEMGARGVSESVAVDTGPDFLLLPPRTEVAELPLPPTPPLHEAPGVRGRPACSSPSLSAPRQEEGGRQNLLVGP